MKPYKLPQKYLEFKEFNKHLEKITTVKPKPIDVTLGGIPPMLNNLSYLYSTWAQGYPVYCVRESLLNDMLLTDVGENLPLFADIELEMPCYLLFLPRGKVKSGNKGCYIDYLIVQHQELDIPEFKYAIAWGCADSGGNWLFGTKRIRRDGTLQASSFLVNSEEQEKIAYEIRNIVLQSILLFQYYESEMVQEMTVVSGKERGFSQEAKTPSQFRLPRWLGEEKHLKTKNTATTTGAGSKKSPHYRRWHWRVQRYGEGRSQTKVIKIRSIWVRGEKEI
jgi:hypothetical protein